ncbi:hypothetical protein FI667_g11088, partial [Globisporangium splendens]
MAHHAVSQQPPSDTIHASLKGATKFQKMCQLKQQQQDLQAHQDPLRPNSSDQQDTHAVASASNASKAKQGSRPEEDHEEGASCRRLMADCFHGPASQSKPVMVLRRCEDLYICTSGFQRIEEELQRRLLDLQRHKTAAITTSLHRLSST